MNPLYQSPFYSLYPDRIIQGARTALALSRTAISTNDESPGSPQGEEPKVSSWQLSRDISAFPQYYSPDPLPDALYHLALEEMENAVEADGTFRTGKAWAGVWTRDISYSIILSMAVLRPETAMHSLRRKVNRGRIVQDTGTGGSWPVSADRMIWAAAAWEIYAVTGDRDWLAESYGIIRSTAEEDLRTLYDPHTGLFRGESSFLDWREQSYPEWMQPADISASAALGTNAVHFRAYTVLSDMAAQLGDTAAAERYRLLADKIRTGINACLWMPEKGYYGQYLYGRQYPLLSPRSDALGEALAVWFGITGPEQQQSVIAAVPVTPFGIPCIYPQIPGIPAYHNNAVWPFVQAYWVLAAAKAGRPGAVAEGIAALYRSAALFLTNKENFEASGGDDAGTQLNSDNMLWSLSGQLAIVYKVLFGLHYEAGALVIRPMVPESMQGIRSLNNFKYRGAILDITLSGFGQQISRVTLDGHPLETAVIPAGLSGRHSVSVVLDCRRPAAEETGMVPNVFSPATPLVQAEGYRLYWAAVPGAASYQIIRNGREIQRQSTLQYTAQQDGEYQVLAAAASGLSSFASEPQLLYAAEKVQLWPLPGTAAAQALTGLSTRLNRDPVIDFTVGSHGRYAADFRYANGNGPVSTGSLCAFRLAVLDGKAAGTFVFPQRGAGAWSAQGFSNALIWELDRGSHQLVLSPESGEGEENGVLNQVWLGQLRLIRLEA